MNFNGRLSKVVDFIKLFIRLAYLNCVLIPFWMEVCLFVSFTLSYCSLNPRAGPLTWVISYEKACQEYQGYSLAIVDDSMLRQSLL